jgi:hypothetical protein
VRQTNVQNDDITGYQNMLDELKLVHVRNASSRGMLLRIEGRGFENKNICSLAQAF